FVVELTWRLLSALAPHWFGTNNQHALTSAGLLRGGDELIRLHDPGPERRRHCKPIRRQDPRPRDWCKRQLDILQFAQIRDGITVRDVPCYGLKTHGADHHRTFISGPRLYPF